MLRLECIVLDKKLSSEHDVKLLGDLKFEFDFIVEKRQQSI